MFVSWTKRNVFKKGHVCRDELYTHTHRHEYAHREGHGVTHVFIQLLLDLRIWKIAEFFKKQKYFLHVRRARVKRAHLLLFSKCLFQWQSLLIINVHDNAMCRLHSDVVALLTTVPWKKVLRHLFTETRTCSKKRLCRTFSWFFTLSSNHRTKVHEQPQATAEACILHACCTAPRSWINRWRAQLDRTAYCRVSLNFEIGTFPILLHSIAR